ncbi:DUF2322 family protein [Phaeobacter sp. C3_T13_0]|uniref:DUF2322 family protein n=1 Tax=Phaeobacter cretensis TaxID=3342641 RepID=UPI0039BC931F
MIQPTASFKDNLRLVPSIKDLNGIEVLGPSRTVVARIDNIPGKQGSLAVYQYLAQNFSTLDADAASHGIAVFAEHTEDAKNHPGVHPNIDLLLGIIAGGAPLTIRVLKS